MHGKENGLKIMALSDHYNKRVCINKSSEGTAPDYEPSFSLQDEFYALLDKQSSSRVVNDRGTFVSIDAKLMCDADVEVTEKDRIKVVEDHIIALTDVGGYHKAEGGNWTLTASAAIGDACIFYLATDNVGTGRQADGDEYSIYSIKNPNERDDHLEILLKRVE